MPEELDEPTVVEEPEKVEEPKEEEPKEEPKEVEEEEEPKEEEEISPFDRPSVKDIKAKYPDLFKDFPSLRDAFFREQAYTKIFPSVEEAREAFEDAASFASLRDDILNGRSDSLLDSINETDPKALKGFASSFLPKLYETSPDAYVAATNPLFESLVKSAYRAGKAEEDEDLQNAALTISKFLFATTEVATGKSTVVKTEEKKTEADTGRFRTFFSNVNSAAEERLAELIQDKLDPDGELNEFMAESLVRKIQREVQNQMERDNDHMSRMNNLWNRAKQAGFTSDWESRIVSAFLERAKPIIPAVRAKMKAAALKGVPAGKKVKAEDNQRRSDTSPGGKTGSESHGPIDPSKVDWSRTSDEDFLAGRIVYKR